MPGGRHSLFSRLHQREHRGQRRARRRGQHDPDGKAFQVEEIILVLRHPFRSPDDEKPGRDGAKQEPVDQQQIHGVENSQDAKNVEEGFRVIDLPAPRPLEQPRGHRRNADEQKQKKEADDPRLFLFRPGLRSGCPLDPRGIRPQKQTGVGVQRPRDGRGERDGQHQPVHDD